jgi:hypothetical protein
LDKPEAEGSEPVFSFRGKENREERRRDEIYFTD